MHGFIILENLKDKNKIEDAVEAINDLFAEKGTYSFVTSESFSGNLVFDLPSQVAFEDLKDLHKVLDKLNIRYYTKILG